MSSQRLDEGALLANRYQILEVVGRGGMGTVYRALDTRLDIMVAVKEMRERDVPADEREAAVRQFEREAKLLGQLHHANLPRVTDFFVEAEHCYLIMEFVQGRTLDTVLREAGGGPLPLLDSLNWGVQLADVLDYLHSQSPPIVFRDMKPANIMIQADGTVKLIDFGIARRFQEGATKDTLLYGSPGYSPPEQYGRAQTDPRSDLYALGATLHHLITGRDPAPTPFKFPPARTVVPELPPQLEAFLARCVEMDENMRCQSADEAREALLQIRAIAQTQAARPKTAPTTGKPATGKTPAGPRVVSARLRQADEIRFLKRFAAIAACFVLIAVFGAAAVRIRSHRTQNPAKPARANHGSKAITAPPPPASDPNNGAGQQQTPAAPEQPATLSVKSIPPGAMIFLDDKQQTPTPREIADVPAGPHTLRLVPQPGTAHMAAVRYIELLPGAAIETDTTLDDTPATYPNGHGTPAAEVKRVEAKEVQLTNPARPGVRLSVSFRVFAALGKSCSVALFFYAADGVTPLKPKAEADRYANAEGQLSASAVFTPEDDPVDYIDFPLYVPAALFPVPSYDEVTYRAVIYVSGTPVAQTPSQPLRQGAQ